MTVQSARGANDVKGVNPSQNNVQGQHYGTAVKNQTAIEERNLFSRVSLVSSELLAESKNGNTAGGHHVMSSFDQRMESVMPAMIQSRESEIKGTSVTIELKKVA